MEWAGGSHARPWNERTGSCAPSTGRPARWPGGSWLGGWTRIAPLAAGLAWSGRPSILPVGSASIAGEPERAAFRTARRGGRFCPSSSLASPGSATSLVVYCAGGDRVVKSTRSCPSLLALTSDALKMSASSQGVNLSLNSHLRRSCASAPSIPFRGWSRCPACSTATGGRHEHGNADYPAHRRSCATAHHHRLRRHRHLPELWCWLQGGDEPV